RIRLAFRFRSGHHRRGLSWGTSLRRRRGTPALWGHAQAPRQGRQLLKPWHWSNSAPSTIVWNFDQRGITDIFQRHSEFEIDDPSLNRLAETNLVGDEDPLIGGAKQLERRLELINTEQRFR